MINKQVGKGKERKGSAVRRHQHFQFPAICRQETPAEEQTH